MNDEDLEDKFNVKLNGRMVVPNRRYFENNITEKQEALQANSHIRTISDYSCGLCIRKGLLE